MLANFSHTNADWSYIMRKFIKCLYLAFWHLFTLIFHQPCLKLYSEFHIEYYQFELPWMLTYISRGLGLGLGYFTSCQNLSCMQRQIYVTVLLRKKGINILIQICECSTKDWLYYHIKNV